MGVTSEKKNLLDKSNSEVSELINVNYFVNKMALIRDQRKKKLIIDYNSRCNYTYQAQKHSYKAISLC